VQHDRSGFEQNKIVFHVDRHLSERLKRAILRLVSFALLEQTHIVAKAGLFERPSHAKIAHQAEPRHARVDVRQDDDVCAHDARRGRGAATQGKGGNQQLARKLAEAIGSERILLNTPASSVTIQGNQVVVTSANGKTLTADDAILTVPPSVWSNIKFDPALPEALRPVAGPENERRLLRFGPTPPWQSQIRDAPAGRKLATVSEPGSQLPVRLGVRGRSRMRTAGRSIGAGRLRQVPHCTRAAGLDRDPAFRRHLRRTT
jgi:phytoene dehydrogenase-like protein